MHVVHYNDITHSERTVHVTSQVGQNNSFPWHTDHGTFYKVCRGQTAPVHSPDPASRIRTNRQGTSGSQPWPCANPHHVLSPSDTSPSLTTRRARGDRLPLRPVSKGPDPRVPSPRLPALTSRSDSSPCPKQPLYMMSQAQSHAEQLNFYIPIQKTRPDKSGLALVASQPQTLSFASCSAWRSA